LHAFIRRIGETPTGLKAGGTEKKIHLEKHLDGGKVKKKTMKARGRSSRTSHTHWWGGGGGGRTTGETGAGKGKNAKPRDI